MCYALYLGSDLPLFVETAGDSDNDRMWLQALESRDDRAVVDKFSKPHVVYVASWQDCGCGWFIDPSAPPQERTRHRELTQTCLSQLKALVDQLLESSDSVELYLTWEGEQRDPVKRTLQLKPVDFAFDQLPLALGDFAVVAA